MNLNFPMMDMPARMTIPRTFGSQNPRINARSHLLNTFIAFGFFTEGSGNRIMQGINWVFREQENIEQISIHKPSRLFPHRLAIYLEMLHCRHEEQVQGDAMRGHVRVAVGAKVATEISALDWSGWFAGRAFISVVEHPVPIFIEAFYNLGQNVLIAMSRSHEPATEIVGVVFLRVFVPDGRQTVELPFLAVVFVKVISSPVEQRNLYIERNCQWVVHRFDLLDCFQYFSNRLSRLLLSHSLRPPPLLQDLLRGGGLAHMMFCFFRDCWFNSIIAA